MKHSLFLLLLSAVTAFSQPLTTGKITGQISDNAQKVVEFANVTLHRAADSSLAKGVLSTERGLFEFENITEGRYFVRVSQLGYQSFKSPYFQVTAENPTIKLAAIQLEESSKTLSEVNVRASKPFIERQLDKIVVNVENSLVSTGASAIEVLERSPNVAVDQDGKLSLKGKQGVIVMIDGKPSQLSGDDLSNFLKGLPSNSIEKIEIITNPSSKYDAAGNAGIINIRLKKDQKLGMNGTANLSYGQGQYEKINGGLSLNYRNKKWNYFGNYNYAYRKQFGNLTLYRKFKTDGLLQSVYDQDTYTIFSFKTHTARAGADYYLSKKTTVGVLLNGVMNQFTPDGLSRTDVLNGREQPDGRFTTINKSRNTWNNGTVNLNFKHTFDSTGRELTADFDYARYQNNNDQLFTTNYYSAANALTGTDILVGDLGGYLNIRSFKADYVHPLGKKSKFEAGLKTSYVTSDNDIKFFNRVDNVDEYDAAKSNHFLYKENINALYTNYNRELGKLTLQLGLRGEQTIADGNQLTTGQTFHRNYIQLFPSIFVKQPLSKDHELGYSLSRRIDRPSYQQLNPFRFFVNPTTYREGNPYLLPQLTYSAEFSHTYKQKITTTLTYSRTTNNITSVLLQNDAERVTVQTDRNLAEYTYYGLGVNAGLQPTKWWSSNNNLNVFYGQFTGDIANTQLRNGSPAFTLNTINSLTLPKGITGELNFFYQSRQVYGISTIEPVYNISAGIQKAILQKKGTLRLNVTDIFYTNNVRGSTTFANIDEIFRTRRDTQVATLAFSYRFGSGTVAPARRRNTGTESEQGRVQLNG